MIEKIFSQKIIDVKGCRVDDNFLSDNSWQIFLSDTPLISLERGGYVVAHMYWF